MEFEDEDVAFQWPQALPLDLWPDEELAESELEKDEFGRTEWDRLYQEKGNEGFLALLRDLAPYLKTPLMILFLHRPLPHYDPSSARAWTVHPGSKEVETLDVSL
jgi:hypothetical protein